MNNKCHRKFRMVALDLDGTLLNSDHDISSTTIAYLRYLHSKKFIIAIATGRSAACAAHVIDKLDLLHYDDDECGETVSSTSERAASGFPLVCTNGARGLKIVRKSKSDVGLHNQHENMPEAATKHSPHRSNTLPLPSENSKSSKESTNPFLNQTLFINEELFHNPLPISVTKQTLQLANKLNCVTNYYHNHHIYAVPRNNKQLELTRRYAKLTGSSELYCYLNNYEENGAELGDDAGVYDQDNVYGYQKALELGPPSKLLILCETDKLDEVTNIVRSELNGGGSSSINASNSDEDDEQCQQSTNAIANVIRGTPPFFVEILNPNVHKGHGLRQLCTSLSIPLDEVLVFGDGDNDLEFLDMAGWGIAMKNARINVKEQADEITRWTNDEVRKKQQVTFIYIGF